MNMHTFSPNGAWPGDSPWSPFCPCNIRTENIFLFFYSDTNRNKIFPCPLQRSLHIFCIAAAPSRGACSLHLHYQRVMTSTYFSAECGGLYLHKRALHLCPPVTRVYTNAERSDVGWEWTHILLPFRAVGVLLLNSGSAFDVHS